MRRKIKGAELERLIQSTPIARLAEHVRRWGAEEVSGDEFMASLRAHFDRRDASQ